LNVSPRTLDTKWAPDSFTLDTLDKAELEKDDMACFLPCWDGDDWGIEDLREFDESTLDEVSHLQRLQSKGSLFGSDDCATQLTKLLDDLELEPSPVKNAVGDHTMTTDDDSTESPDPFDRYLTDELLFPSF
jgi:hypothetical protein